MVYCSNCGKELSEGTKYCPACGSTVNAPSNYIVEPRYTYYKKEESGAAAWGILSFFLTIFTVVGGIILCLILYGCDRPKGGFAAIMGMVAAIAVAIIVCIIMIILMMGFSSPQYFVG